MFKSVIALAAIAATSFVAAPAQAASCGHYNGHDVCAQYHGYGQWEVVVNNKHFNRGYMMSVDCNSGTWQASRIDGFSRSNISAMAAYACAQ